MSYMIDKAVRAICKHLDHPSKWCKGMTIDGDAICLEIAINRGIDDTGFSSLLQQIKDTFRYVIPPKYGGSIISFNDDPETTYEDIVYILNKARKLSGIRDLMRIAST